MKFDRKHAARSFISCMFSLSSDFSKDPYTYGDGNKDKGNHVTFTDGESDMLLKTFVEDSIKTDIIVVWTERWVEFFLCVFTPLQVYVSKTHFRSLRY